MIKSFYRKIKFISVFATLCLPFILKAQVINTGVCISYDGNAMIYTVIDENKKPQFFQSLKNAMWQWDEGMPIQILNQYIDSVGLTVKDPFVSPDGQTLYFSANLEGSKGLDIYYSLMKNGVWQKPEPMPVPINSDDDDESPSITADNRYFYFARKTIPAKQLSDDEYCRSIYCSKLTSDGSWGEPEFVRASMLGCEAYPSISPDGKTLFFSSSKLPHKKKQKYDVYYVTETSPNVWSMPKAVDTLNSEFNEISAAVDFHTKQLYVLQVEQTRREIRTKFIASKLPIDVTAPKLLTFTGKTVDMDNKPIVSEVTIKNPVSLDVVNRVNTDEQGYFNLMLLSGYDYRFDFYAPSYSQFSRNYSFANTEYNHADKDNLIKLFKTVNLRLNVYDKDVFLPLNAGVTVIEKGTNEYFSVKKQDIDGQFIINLPVEKKYTIKIEESGYNAYSFDFDISQIIFFDEFEEDIALVANREIYNINIITAPNNAPFDARVDIVNTDVDESINVRDEKTGVYFAGLRKNNNYNLIVTEKGYSFDSRIIKSESNTNKAINVRLMPLVKQTKIALHTIAFVPNSLDLTTDSYNELNCLVELMLENPEMTIEVGAYNDNKAVDVAFAGRLTENQARSVAEYLILKGGITKDRVKSKGYGKETPANLNFTGSMAGDKNAKALVWYTVIEPARIPEKSMVKKSDDEQQIVLEEDNDGDAKQDVENTNSND